MDAKKEEIPDYEYQEIFTWRRTGQLYLESYPSLGFVLLGEYCPTFHFNKITLRFQRRRNISNRTELIRLQGQLDACIGELDRLERPKKITVCLCSAIAGSIGLQGIFFITGSSLLFKLHPLAYALSICSSLICWLLTLLIFRILKRWRRSRIAPLVTQKYEELYKICQKGERLLPKPNANPNS